MNSDLTSCLIRVAGNRGLAGSAEWRHYLLGTQRFAASVIPHQWGVA
jgi:hypothetical protein